MSLHNCIVNSDNNAMGTFHNDHMTSFLHSGWAANIVTLSINDCIYMSINPLVFLQKSGYADYITVPKIAC